MQGKRPRRMEEDEYDLDDDFIDDEDVDELENEETLRTGFYVNEVGNLQLRFSDFQIFSAIFSANYNSDFQIFSANISNCTCREPCAAPDFGPACDTT